MKLKYYLRGLGVGIFVTALIMTIAHHISENKRTMTDSEIISAAKKLGMVMEEETLFPETTEYEEETTVEDSTEEETSEEETSEEETTEEETTVEETTAEPETEPETEKPTEPETEKPTEPETEKPTKSVTEYTLTISSGMYSEKVSELLANAGIVSSANDFNNYLINNGYAERLCTGTFKLNTGMSNEEIARAITQ